MDTYGKPIAIARGLHEVSFETVLPLRAGQYQLDVSLSSVAGGRIDRWAADPMMVVVPRHGSDTTLHPEWQGLIDSKVAVTIQAKSRP
jgi:hypothetical protein